VAQASTLMSVIRNGLTTTPTTAHDSSSGGAVVRAPQPWGDAQLALLYDAFRFDADLPFYLDLAAAQGTRVLEVACGSGRVLVPLAQAGYRLVGIDVSPHMLALAQAKLDRQSTPNARLLERDMRDFSLEDEAPFDLAIVAVKSFAYLVERDEQLRCLRSIWRHLRPGGLLAIDFLHPRPEWIGAANGSMRDDLLQRVADRGFTLSRIESVVSTDLARQIRTIRSIYESVDDSGQVTAKRFVEWPYRWTHRFEAEHLLERAGFTLEHLYGGYAQEAFDADSTSMVFVARKPG
jgi:SAM-dependent methyltransferase